MPTILVWNGYRFHFYSNEKGEPPHVHVTKAGNTCKIWLPEQELAYNDGFRHNDMHVVMEGIEQHREVLMAAWVRIHGH